MERYVPQDDRPHDRPLLTFAFLLLTLRASSPLRAVVVQNPYPRILDFKLVSSDTALPMSAFWRTGSCGISRSMVSGPV